MNGAGHFQALLTQWLNSGVNMKIERVKGTAWLSDIKPGTVFRIDELYYMRVRVPDERHDVIHLMRMDTGDVQETLKDAQVDQVYPDAVLRV